MTATVISKKGIPIRLTERWAHIIEEHAELAGLRQEVLEAIADPIRIFAGSEEASLAVRETGLGKYIVVVYREIDGDGFVITAFLTRRMRFLKTRKQVWP